MLNHLEISSEGRKISVLPHVLVYEMQHGHRFLLFASYVGVAEEIKAVSASILENREVRYGNMLLRKLYQDQYRRVERPMGLGDTAHGCVYSSFFELGAIEAEKEPEQFNRALLFAADGDIQSVFAKHVIARFGLPHEWSHQYYRVFSRYIEPLIVQVNPVFGDEYANAAAIRFTANENDVIRVMDEALKSYRLVIPECDMRGELDPNWSMSEYMLKNAPHLAAQLSELKPRHTFDQPLDPAIGDLERIPFPIQAHAIQALVNTYEDPVPEACFLGGDMGSGKSIMGCGVVHVLHERRKRRTGKSGMAVLLAAPGITLPKWKTKEIEATIPNVKVNIIRNGNDALALLRKVKAGYKPSTVEFTMVGIDRAKLGSESYFDGIWKRMHTASKREDKLTYAWHCPDCGKPIMVPLDDKKDDEDQLVPAGWDAFAEGVAPTDEDIMEARRNRQLLSNGLPKDWKVKWIRKASIKRSCDNEVALLGESATEDARMLYPISRKCKAQFFRPALKSRGETNIKPRINISQVLKRLKGWFDLFIMDEAHQAKGADSGRGDAFGQMVKSAKRTMMLTGTLTTGKSTSVKELLWRTDPKLLLDAGIDYHTGDIEWATRFGKIEQIIKDDEGDVGVVTRKKKRSITSREAPGIAPQMTAQFLIHKSVFLELTDMGLPLVELKEIPMFLEMDKEHALEYRRFHDTLYDACKIASARSSGVSGAWSKFNPATLMYASRPELGMTVTLGDGVYEAKPIGTEADSHALERWLIETVQMELADGRGCIIYNQFTGNYGMNERVQTILSRNGIRSQILDEPNPEMRTTRLAEYEEAAVPVIITNMKLVEVGLDMMYWPTIIYNQLSYEVNTVRQSSRRSWRIGQDRECRVYYPIYNGTQKMKQFLHIMSARGHALMVEGRLDKSELAEYSRDSQSSLARDLASCFAGAEVAAAWERLAAKEMEGLEIIAEANFKEVLQQRMKDLADETLRLCGIDPVVWREEREARKSMPAPTLQTNEEANVVDEEYPLDLFSMLEAAAAKNVTVNEPVPTQEEKREEDAIRIMTFAEAMLEKGKSSRGKKKHVEDQLLWDFGS